MTIKSALLNRVDKFWAELSILINLHISQTSRFLIQIVRLLSFNLKVNWSQFINTSFNSHTVTWYNSSLQMIDASLQTTNQRLSISIVRFDLLHYWTGSFPIWMASISSTISSLWTLFLYMKPLIVVQSQIILFAL